MNTRPCLLLTLLLLILTGVISSVRAETRIFDLHHRQAAEVAEALRTVLGDDARVAAVDRSLVIDATRGDLAVAGELIGRLDRPRQMLRIFISQGLSRSVGGTDLSAAGRISGGDATVVIGRLDLPPPGGATVIVGSGDDRLRLGARAGSYQESRSVEQFVVALEGSLARLSVGQRIPVTERWLDLARRHGRLVESVRYESIDTGFEVEAELLGGVAQLDIRPFMAFLSPYRPREISFQELTTRVNVPLGQWFDLGGTMAAGDEVSREILGTASRSEGGAGSVRVRVELQPN